MTPLYGSSAYRRHVEAEEDALGLTDDLLRAYRDEAQATGATADDAFVDDDDARQDAAVIDDPEAGETRLRWA